MKILLLFLSISAAIADPSWKWTNAIDVVEKHEFYQNNQIIDRPKDIWQTLFAVRYHDSNLKTFKDCVFYKVPGIELGILKIKTIPEEKRCEDFIHAPGDNQWSGLKALQFSYEQGQLTVSLTDEKFQITRWDVPLFNVFQKPEPKMLMSSAEYRSAKLLFLQPYKGQQPSSPLKPIEQNKLKQCHEVSDDCQEIKPSSCSLCPNGWYEVPNGCAQGPKFCGSVICGTKGAPACRRGMNWQRQNKTYRCREDSSFAYCARGLRIQCEGNLAYCL